MRIPITVILLQHAGELNRPTGTGSLLQHESLAPHLRVDRWVWAGRGDNEQIQAHIKQCELCGSVPRLLWTTGSAGSTVAQEDEDVVPDAETRRRYAKDDARTFIILDGTWQEALGIFRRGPECLRHLPRVALDAGPSSYVLRADYGWRDRFTAAGSAEPLCTAETAAALLEQRADDTAGGFKVRALLESFQVDYAASHPHIYPHLAQFTARRHEQPLSAALGDARTGRLGERRFPEVTAFYRRNGYRRRAKPGDVVFVLRDAGRGGPDQLGKLGAIIGAVRCTPTGERKDHYLLQSLCIARNRRRAGLGSALVMAAVADLGESSIVYCHSGVELRGLYESAGFAVLMVPPAWMAAEHKAMAARRQKRGGLPLLLMAKGVGGEYAAPGAAVTTPAPAA